MAIELASSLIVVLALAVLVFFALLVGYGGYLLLRRLLAPEIPPRAR